MQVCLYRYVVFRNALESVSEFVQLSYNIIKNKLRFKVYHLWKLVNIIIRMVIIKLIGMFTYLVC